jgi:hypothetical protein
MARFWGYILVCLMSWDFLENSVILNRAIQSLLVMRHKLLVDRNNARMTSCQEKSPSKVLLFWKERGNWVDVCQSPSKTGYLPRLWRIEFTYNYRMLFLSELPITFAIVIKH